MEHATYCVIDVETPNHRNDRISSIGIVRIANGSITETRSYLVNPEAEFDPINARLTGLTADDVQDSPTLPEIWAEVAPMVTGAVVVAHNAPFDLTVLCKALAAYGIACPPLEYFDTVQLAKVALPDLPDHRLDTLCSHYGIALDHHQAGSDSVACAQLFVRLQERAGSPRRWDWAAKGQRPPRSHQAQHSQPTHIHTHPLIVGNVDFDGKRVCLSGEFATGSKADIAAALEQRGAVIRTCVSKRLHYLIVGELGSDAWSGGSAGGRKIRQAQELQAQGASIKILRELEIFAPMRVEVRL